MVYALEFTDETLYHRQSNVVPDGSLRTYLSICGNTILCPMIRSTTLCTQSETVYEQLLHIMGIDDGLVIPELKF